MKHRICLLLLALCCALTASGTGEQKNDLNSILASVNGTPVSLQDVLPLTRSEEFKAFNTLSGKELQSRIIAIRRKAVDGVIDRKLIIEDYKAQKFRIQERDIELAVDDIADRMGLRSREDFVKELRKSGSDMKTLRKNVEESMIVHLMFLREYAAAKNITPAGLFERYQAEKKKTQQSGTIELAMILLNSLHKEKAEEIRNRLLQDPESFSRLAGEFSSGPGREDGGRLGKISSGLLRPEFADALKNPQKNKIYGPLETREGIVFLKVLNYTAPRQLSFRESIPELRKAMEAEQKEESKRNYLRRLRKEAIIRYFF